MCGCECECVCVCVCKCEGVRGTGMFVNYVQKYGVIHTCRSVSVHVWGCMCRCGGGERAD